MTGDAATELLREVLRVHHPIMRSETGPFSGCRCGGVKLGEDVIQHVAAALLPVVEAECRRRAAEELRAAARGRSSATSRFLNDRADAIEGRP